MCSTQGFYVNMVYHSFAVKDGGDTAVLNEPSWVQSWVALMKQVQQSDVCEVSTLSAVSAPGFCDPWHQ